MRRPSRRSSCSLLPGLASVPAALLLGVALGSTCDTPPVTAAGGGWVSLDGHDAVPQSPAAACRWEPAAELEFAVAQPGCADGAGPVAIAAGPVEPAATCDPHAWHTLGSAEWARRYPGLVIESAPACVAAASPSPAGRSAAGG